MLTIQLKRVGAACLRNNPTVGIETAPLRPLTIRERRSVTGDQNSKRTLPKECDGVCRQRSEAFALPTFQHAVFAMMHRRSPFHVKQSGRLRIASRTRQLVH